MFGENMAVNVVDAKSVISDTIGWAHEVRHNFGLKHDYEHANPKDGPPVLDYAYGHSYCDEFVHFGDIMSYSCDDYYKPQPLYSSPDSYRMDTSGNPDLRYPIGMKDKADARQAMMDMAKTVANYRHSRAAELYKFSSGSKFTSPSVKFAWNNGVKVDRYKLTVSSMDGSRIYFNKEFTPKMETADPPTTASGNDYDATHSAVVEKLPTDGKSIVSVSLSSFIADRAELRTYTFTAADPPDLSVFGKLEVFRLTSRTGAGSQKLRVVNTGAFTPVRLLSSDQSWLKVTPSSGVVYQEDPLEITVTASAQTLPSQTQLYQEKIRIVPDDPTVSVLEQTVQLSVSGEGKPAIEMLQAFPTNQPLPKACRPLPVPVNRFHLSDTRFEGYFEFKGYAPSSRESAQMIDPDGKVYPFDDLLLPNLTNTQFTCDQAGAVKNGQGVAVAGRVQIPIRTGIWRVHLLLNGLRIKYCESQQCKLKRTVVDERQLVEADEACWDRLSGETDQMVSCHIGRSASVKIPSFASSVITAPTRSGQVKRLTGIHSGRQSRLMIQ